ncbi:endonuclease exonuclease phosphatase [Fusarium albosuccineum]|uniref:Endonuclease exonuclease phosphatase n=1 Tax=Fusarium albosuccineum TaxID=1237068 RepID=A0A8H4PDG4_9HYPO|nr:endonuclease exonuclease phosphatase [Fusarium albosuccineum]
MRWPGLWLDRELSFKVHADEWNSKAKMCRRRRRSRHCTARAASLSLTFSSRAIGVASPLVSNRLIQDIRWSNTSNPRIEDAQLDYSERLPFSPRLLDLSDNLAPPGHPSDCPTRRLQNNGVGYGFVIFRGEKLIGTGCGGLRSAEVYDAEVLGALAGLKRALNITTHRVPIHLCLYNNSVIGGLRGRPGESSQLSSNSGPWQKHTAESTRAGAQDTWTRDEFLNWWTYNMPEAYIPLDLKAELSCKNTTHHGDFADYHERFNQADSANNCSCGRRKNAYTSFAAAKWRLTNDYGWDRRRCRRSAGQ